MKSLRTLQTQMAGGLYGLAISLQSIESRFWLLIYTFEQNVKIACGFACQVMTTFETALPRQTSLINLAHQASLSSNAKVAVKTENVVCWEFLWGCTVVSGGLDLLCGWISGSISLVALEPCWPVIFFSALNLVVSLCAVYRSIAQSCFCLSALCLLCFIWTESHCAL